MTDTKRTNRHDFDVLFLTKMKVAICLASVFIKSLNLDELTLEKKVLKLRKELDFLIQKIYDFEFNEYLIFADNVPHLYNIFLERSLFYYTDEEAILEESLILNEKYKQLSQLLLESKAQLLIFTSNVSICCLSLINYKPGLTDVPEEKIDLNDPPDLSYEQLFEHIFEQGTVQSEKRIAEFKRKYPCDDISDDKYQSIISNELNKLRVNWNNWAYPDYYQFLLVKENVKSYFLNNCLLNIYIENHKVELTRTFELNEMIQFLENELCQINKKLIRTSSDLDLLIHQISEIISVMVPNHELINELKKAFALTSKSLKAGKPILFIVLDLEDSFPTIFSHALLNLQQFLETQPSDKKVIYVTRQILDLEYMELIESRNEHNLNPYIVDLKKPFKTELKCMQFRQNYKPENQVHIDYHIPETGTQELKPDNNKLLTFNYNGIKDDKITDVKNALIGNNAIPPETTSAQLRAKFNGKEPGKPIEWLAGQGDLATFIKEIIRIMEPEFTSYNQHWNIVVKCFVKKGGIEFFDPQQLRFSKPTLLEQKFIEAARKFK